MAVSGSVGGTIAITCSGGSYHTPFLITTYHHSIY